MLVTDPENATFYQIIMNSIGVYRVLFHKHGPASKTDKNFILSSKAKITNDRWTLQIKIPLNQFKSITNHKWRFNIFRSRNLTDELNNSTNIQSSGLRIISKSYLDLNEHHKLVFHHGIKYFHH